MYSIITTFFFAQMFHGVYLYYYALTVCSTLYRNNPTGCNLTNLLLQWDHTSWWIPLIVSQGPQLNCGVHLYQHRLQTAYSWTSIIICMALQQTWSLLSMLSSMVSTCSRKIDQTKKEIHVFNVQLSTY